MLCDISPSEPEVWEELFWAVLALTDSRVLMAGAAPELQWETQAVQGRAAREAAIAGDGPAALSLSQLLYVAIGPLHVGEFDLSHTPLSVRADRVFTWPLMFSKASISVSTVEAHFLLCPHLGSLRSVISSVFQWLKQKKEPAHFQGESS